MGKRFLRRPSPALIVALIALFVALGGTGYAAFSLPKNSVGTAQIKNRAITETKINKKTLALLHGRRGAAGTPGAPGKTGATGPIGPQGIQGVQGPVGPSTKAVVDSMPGMTVLSDPTSNQVALLNLSSGKYIVIAKTTIQNPNGNENTYCRLDDTGANEIDASWTSTSNANSGYPSQNTLSLMAPLNSGGSTVSFNCSSDRTDTTALGTQLIAIKIDSWSVIAG